MTIAHLDNHQIYYQLTGSPNQPVIMFLHGFMGNSQDWENIISPLANKYRCLTLDLPGHGHSKTTGGDSAYTISHTAHSLIQLLDMLNINKCFLVGYSMGGRLALYTLLQYQGRFQKAILESASPGLKTPQEQSQRRQQDAHLAQQLETGDFSEFVSKWYQQPLFATLQNHPQSDQIIQKRLQNNPQELAKSLRMMGTGQQPSLWDKLQHNHIPILLLAGEQDSKFIAINTEIAATCPAAQLEIIPQAGHNIHLENLPVYLQQLIIFFT
ncbi:MAG TPA: 2-succinyl-6-hydroxy-2,4-cyclohexadiene-1-carboxylate synthase [Oscillatoriaceae cyanobacterium M33_DOE_052]|uniref:Putative 2-succinyl-6-hydroxy-2,4-cyclohexadiene-1-carboxylate synthase n=1 Tax=Planktothricoides sp. SpSt-374 TaxID=2282167 RepID=A0A7C3ZZU7_9CYAN|nr:2-succinyl-6-hydroxy-2,4-cyclohexadiene-1-carboxylate synthase [Oscillatoriaceae cyanobacterium M33_DOE_052]